MTPSPRKSSPETHPLLKWALGIVSTGIIGLFIFLWQLNSSLAIMQNNDKYREEKVRDIDKNVNTLVNEIRGLKEMDLQSIKDRLKELELKKDEDTDR